MQQLSNSTDGSIQAAAGSSPPLFLSPDGQNSSPPWFISSGEEFLNSYPPIFFSKKSPEFPSSAPLRCSTSVSLTPSSVSCEEEVDDAAATENRLYLARLALQYEEMLDRYELCLSHLEDATAEAEALRLENAKFRIANAELARRISLLSTFGQRNDDGSGLMEASAGYSSSLLNEFHLLQLSSDTPPPELSPTSAPDCHMENRLPRKPTLPEHRSGLPKSISIRSGGYMKLASSNRNGRARVPNPVLLGTRKVYVPVDDDDGGVDGRQKEKEASTLELEVYAQGMFKTELCNKWQQTGSCPYGEHCQFAHGVAELRPVIRHPRYKTEVCRMILAGGTCPYGHRCHFRHALTPQDYSLLGLSI